MRTRQTHSFLALSITLLLCAGTARAEPTPSEGLQAQGLGLGVSRAAFKSKMEELEMDMTYKEEPLINQKRLMGHTQDFYIGVELIGPANDLNEITVTFVPSKGALKNVRTAGVLGVMLALGTRNPAENLKWVGDSLSKPPRKAIRIDGPAKLTLNNYSEQLGLVTIGIEVNEFYGGPR